MSPDIGSLSTARSGEVVDYVAERPLKMPVTGYDRRRISLPQERQRADDPPQARRDSFRGPAPAPSCSPFETLSQRQGRTNAHRARAMCFNSPSTVPGRRGAQVTFRNSEVGPAAEIRTDFG